MIGMTRENIYLHRSRLYYPLDCALIRNETKYPQLLSVFFFTNYSSILYDFFGKLCFHLLFIFDIHIWRLIILISKIKIVRSGLSIKNHF